MLCTAIIRLKNIDLLDDAVIEWVCDELGIFQSTAEFVAHTPSQMLNWIDRIDSTSLAIFEDKNVTISRLSYGLPSGAEIDYLDMLTLDKALEDRKKISE